MLVLSRHRDESIVIGDSIVVTVIEIRGDKVRLGITAPVETSVHRSEIYEEIHGRGSMPRTTMTMDGQQQQRQREGR